MKIELNNALRAYSQNKAVKTAPKEIKSSDNHSIAAGQDTISISSTAAQRSEVELMVKNGASEIEKAAAARVAQLKESVAQGTYHVATEKLADAVLSTIV